jgi:RNase P subunit RPR2
MIVQSAFQGTTGLVPSIRAHATKNLRRPKCPRCGSVLLFAEESRFNARGRIDHTWSCDDCGHCFVTVIRVWRR